MDEREELVGRHDDHDAEDDEHGERAGNADDLGLGGSGNEHFKAGPEQTAHAVHEDDGRKEAADHERRPDKDAEEEDVASFSVLTRRAFSFRQGMSGQPERSGNQ